MTIKQDIKEIIDKTLTTYTKELREGDVIAGKVRCYKCKTKLRLTFDKRVFCPKCLKYLR